MAWGKEGGGWGERKSVDLSSRSGICMTQGGLRFEIGTHFWSGGSVLRREIKVRSRDVDERHDMFSVIRRIYEQGF